ncbi:MAG: cardiolipin synthase ClsB [Proteobacteria bacterium]|nr:cardiolipin synthase ClsB [Pseudomonadota bacterium]
MASRGCSFVSGNRLTLLQNGDQYFPAIEASFDRAKFEIYLETYIFAYDATGQRIVAALKRAVARGVKVYMLIDGYGSKELPGSVIEQMRHDGLNVIIYRPKISPWTFRRNRLRRMHRKIVVVDREIAFVGGINIINDRENEGVLFSRYDYAVAVEGPIVDEIRRSCKQLWSKRAWRFFRHSPLRPEVLPVSRPSFGAMSVAFLTRDNLHHRRDIEMAYLDAFGNAQSEIILANAYFLPGRDFRQALIGAAKRGVKVVLLLQGKVEYFLQHYASRALYGSLLDAGIEIYEYPKSFLHAKVAVVDMQWATVGSSNIDPFSLLLSREANVVVLDDAFSINLALNLKKTIQDDGQKILSDHWKEQSYSLRFVSWICYGLMRLMMGISGYARSPSPPKKR